jgi:flavin reductase (DIM6/NTAB) family NADH-FMN oxidoreductase RutF
MRTQGRPPHKRPAKQDVPVANLRRYLEPGPIVLVSSAFERNVNIMTRGWHLVMAFTPSLLGCMIAASNFSLGLSSRSREYVITLPTTRLVDAVVGIGNCPGQAIDKFAAFGRTPVPPPPSRRR